MPYVDPMGRSLKLEVAGVFFTFSRCNSFPKKAAFDMFLLSGIGHASMF